ncbi:ABC transporter ATP-binding protein [Dactylosporangium sp. CS-033363]|uniref:ABC transporter ATP-binding protein n=1 Tax=Dactylosporangium sp. CS-033363 TaxID=3239935 RepID=UPI003D8D4F4A
MTVELHGLQKQFAGGVRAVGDFTLSVAPGEFITFLGPSGCGKTTTLRCIAGLESPDTGMIRIGDTVVFEAGAGRRVDLPPERRDISMVFQQYALWPHLSVFENVAFPLRSRKRPRAQIAPRVETALKSVQLWEQRDRQIGQLSGGQQQRVALARAIVDEPAVVLFDEPLSNLDVKLRESMRIEIMDLHRRMGLTSIYVTHDQDEAFALSTRIVVMRQGLIEQIGTPQEIWNDPASAFVAGFVGSSTSIEGVLVGAGGVRAGEIGTLVSETGLSITFRARRDLAAQSKVVAFLRAGDLRLSAQEPAGAANDWKGEFALQSFHGDHTTVFVTVHGVRLTCRAADPWAGDERVVYVSIPEDRVLVYPTGDGQE